MDTDVAACRLVDERRYGDRDGDGRSLAEDTGARERLQRYVMRVGSMRRDSGTSWTFGRRQLDERFFLFEFGERDERATICLLPGRGVLLADRGGPPLENEYVGTFLRGYYDHHDGAFELHAQPLGAEGIDEACVALVRTGLTTEGGEGRGPFADALGHIATELATGSRSPEG